MSDVGPGAGAVSQVAPSAVAPVNAVAMADPPIPISRVTGLQDALDAVSGVDLSTVVPKGRYRSEYIDAAAMAPADTNGATTSKIETTTNKNIADRYLFDGATAQSVYFKFTFDDVWNRGAIRARAYWDAATGGSGGVTWGISAYAFSDSDVIDTAMGTEATTSDTVIAVGDVHITPSALVTIGGGPALGDIIIFRIRRLPSDANDTMTQQAALMGVEIQWAEGSTEPVVWA